MSKLLRLPLTLLAVLAAMLFLPGLAWADTPTAAQCASPTPPAGCVPAPGGTPANDTTGGTTATQPKTAPAPKDGAGTTGQQPGGQSTDKPAAGLLVVPFQVPDQAQGAVVGVNDALPASPPDVCTTFPQIPACSPKPPPTVPLTCDGLAQLLGQTGGCPSSFSCQDLAKLLGITCPAGPPDCTALAQLFHLQGCPQPPKDCDDFAALLGVQKCSQIPCLDTSKLPQQARDGLQQLFDGLKNIGIKQCPAPPTTDQTTPPGQGTQMPNPPAQQPPPPADTVQPAVATTPTTAAQPTGRLAFTGLDIAPQLNLAWSLLVLGTGLLILGRRRA